MDISPLGVEFIVSFEKVRLSAYDDGCGVLTIGIGRIEGVKRGDTCTEQQAYAWFHMELWKTYVPAVVNNVHVGMEQYQFDALVSFVYNAGVNALKSSTLLRLLNQRDYSGAAAQFHAWNKGLVNRALVPIPGLTARRKAEKDMFEKGKYDMHDGLTIMAGVIPFDKMPDFSDVVAGVSSTAPKA